MNRCIALLVVATACTTTSNSPPISATVSCSGAVVKQVDATDCTIGAGTCSDGNSYVLTCYSGGGSTFIGCQCAIDAVSEDSLGLQIAGTTCASATMLSPSELERAWLDCGIDLTFSGM